MAGTCGVPTPARDGRLGAARRRRHLHALGGAVGAREKEGWMLLGTMAVLTASQKWAQVLETYIDNEISFSRLHQFPVVSMLPSPNNSESTPMLHHSKAARAVEADVILERGDSKFACLSYLQKG